MPAPQTTATPQPRLGARAQHREGVVADRRCARPSPRSATAACEPRSSSGRSTPGEQHRATSATGPPRGRGPRGQRAREQALEDVEAALHADVVRRAERAAHEREQLAVAAHQGQIGLRVAAVDREHDRRAHRTTASAAEQPVAAAPRRSRAGRSADASAAPSARWHADRRSPPPGRSSRSYAATCWTRPEQLRARAAPAAAARARRAPMRAGTSTTSSAARPGQRAARCARRPPGRRRCRRHSAATSAVAASL